MWLDFQVIDLWSRGGGGVGLGGIKPELKSRQLLELRRGGGCTVVIPDAVSQLALC